MGRVVLPDYPHHIVQRGLNQQVVFAQEDDFRSFLKNLHELKVLFGMQVFAYCLMSNHVHLLLQPRDAADLARFMKTLAARTTRHFNRMAGRRRGSLWESRYKSSPVQAESYLLACCRFIELNPVRARLVDHPGGYRWSSFTARTGEAGNDWLDVDPMYLALGDDDAIRQNRYKIFLDEAIPPGEWELIREAVKRSQLTGDARFADVVEQIIGRRIERRGPGRPFKKGAEEK